ncbi:MAG: hypothetical protein ABIV51_06235 [Saprospiraceae bacterium]
MNRIKIVLLLLSCIVTQTVQAQKGTSGKKTVPPIEQRVLDLQKKLSPSEKLNFFQNEIPANPALGLPAFNWAEMFSEAINSLEQQGPVGSYSPDWDLALIRNLSIRAYDQVQTMNRSKIPVQAAYLHTQKATQNKFQQYLGNSNVDYACKIIEAQWNRDDKSRTKICAGIIDPSSFAPIWEKTILDPASQEMLKRLSSKMDVLFIVANISGKQDSIGGKYWLKWIRENAKFQNAIVVIPNGGPQAIASAEVDLLMSAQSSTGAVDEKKLKRLLRLYIKANATPASLKPSVATDMSLPVICLKQSSSLKWSTDRPMEIFLTGPLAYLTEANAKGELQQLQQAIQDKTMTPIHVTTSSMPDVDGAINWQELKTAEVCQNERKPGLLQTVEIGSLKIDRGSRNAMYALPYADLIFQSKGFQPYISSWRADVGINTSKLRIEIKGGGQWFCKMGTEILMAGDQAPYEWQSFELALDSDMQLPLNFEWHCKKAEDQFQVRFYKQVNVDSNTWIAQANKSDLILFIGGDDPYKNVYPSYFPGNGEKSRPNPHLGWPEIEIQNLLLLANTQKPLISFDISSEATDLARVYRVSDWLYKVAHGQGIIDNAASVIWKPDLAKGLTTCPLPGEAELLPILPNFDEADADLDWVEPEAPSIPIFYQNGQQAASREIMVGKLSISPDTLRADYKGAIKLSFQIRSKNPSAGYCIAKLKIKDQVLIYEKLKLSTDSNKRYTINVPYKSWKQYGSKSAMALGVQIEGQKYGKRIMIPAAVKQ